MTKKHYCHKETEFKEITNYITQQKIDTQKIRDDIGYIKKAITGDGEVGIIEQVDKNTTFRIGYEAKSNLLRLAVGGGWFTTLILFLLTYFHK